MYTATLIGDTKNIELRRRMINVEFTDGTNTFAKEFQFRIDETTEVMKRTVKQYLDELNFVPPDITDVDYIEPTPATPTQAELDRDAWVKDLSRLQRAQKMEALGVAILTPTQITALQTKIKANWKVEYEDLIPLQ